MKRLVPERCGPENAHDHDHSYRRERKIIVAPPSPAPSSPPPPSLDGKIVGTSQAFFKQQAAYSGPPSPPVLQSAFHDRLQPRTGRQTVRLPSCRTACSAIARR